MPSRGPAVVRMLAMVATCICVACTRDLTEVASPDPQPVVHATIVAGQHLQLVSVEWTATGTTIFTRDSIVAPDTAAQVLWTTPDGRVLEAEPLWRRTGVQSARGLYAVAATGADSALLATSRYAKVSSDGLPRLDIASVHGRYGLLVQTSRGDVIRGTVTVYPPRTGLRVLHVSAIASDTLMIRDTVAHAMPMSVATVTSRENYATVITDRGLLRVPFDAPGRTDRAIAMFPVGQTSRLVHYALDTALARAFWGANDPLHAGGATGNLSGGLGVVGYLVPMTVAYITRD